MLDIRKIEAIVKVVSTNNLMPWFNKVQAHSKQDGSLITQADLSVQEALRTELLKHFPDYAFFSEEMSKNEMEAFFAENHSGYWCLDPLDGTSNFSSGIPYFAISLALIKNNQTVLGLVYDPVRDECFSAIKGEGAWLNDQAIVKKEAPEKLSECIANVDLKRLPKNLAIKLVTEPPYRSQRSFGAAALDWCWLATHRCQLFLHGKQMIWDYASGLLIAQESGSVGCDLQGAPIFEQSLVAKKIVAAVDESLQKDWFEYISS